MRVYFQKINTYYKTPHTAFIESERAYNKDNRYSHVNCLISLHNRLTKQQIRSKSLPECTRRSSRSYWWVRGLLLATRPGVHQFRFLSHGIFMTACRKTSPWRFLNDESGWSGRAEAVLIPGIFHPLYLSNKTLLCCMCVVYPPANLAAVTYESVGFSVFMRAVINFNRHVFKWVA